MSIIEDLKDPKLAQPYYVLSMEAKAILEKAGCKNRLWLNRSGKWILETDSDECNVCHLNNAYILKPDYQPQPKPEPEYIDLEIVRGSDWYGAESRPDFILPLQFVPLNCLESLPRFEEFWYSDEGAHISPYRQDIVKLIEVEHHAVHARFRKE